MTYKALEDAARKALVSAPGLRDFQDYLEMSHPEAILSVLEELSTLKARLAACPALGTLMQYSPAGKYQEWAQGGPYYFAGISASLHVSNFGKPNLWIAEKWPIEHGGHITDGFSPDDWILVSAPEAKPEALCPTPERCDKDMGTKNCYRADCPLKSITRPQG